MKPSENSRNESLQGSMLNSFTDLYLYLTFMQENHVNT